mgnify:CR=1 FL=1
MNVLCSVSLDELVDKISILVIKGRHIKDDVKLQHVKKEESALRHTLDDLKLQGMEPFLDSLVEINSALWKIEDDIREKERQKKFDQEFIELARAVYVTNDQRFKVKNEINTKFGSEFHEVKSYKEY